MGEYIINPRTGETQKLATVDDCFFTREEVENFEKEGWIGQEPGTSRDIIRRLLDDPLTLYKIPEATNSWTVKGSFYDPRLHTVIIENSEKMEHDKVIAQIKGNRGSVYTYTGLKCLQEGEAKVWARIIGERYREGKGRTIFCCDCCEKPFSLGEAEAEKLRQAYPYWAYIIKGNGKE